MKTTCQCSCVEIKPMWQIRCSALHFMLSSWRQHANVHTLRSSQCDKSAAQLFISIIFSTFTKHVLCYLYFFHLQCYINLILRTLSKNFHLILMHNVLRLTTHMCVIPCFWITKLPMIDNWPPIPNQLAIRDQAATYPSPLATESQHQHFRNHHLSPSRTSTLLLSLAHVINTDLIYHCDSECFLSLSDSLLTISSHSDWHLEPKCVICHLVSRRKAGLSCTKCHNYFHLSCIKLRIPLNTARMLPSWRCSDFLFGSVTFSDKPSITGATSNESVLDQIGVLNSAVYTCQTNRVIMWISKSCRIQVASALSDTIANALSSQTPLSWAKLFFFAMEMFGIPTLSGNDHRTSKTAQQIHVNLRRHLLTSSTDTPCPLWQLNHPPSYNRRPSAIDNKQRLCQLVNWHISVNDVPAAVRAVASDDILYDITPDVLESFSQNTHLLHQILKSYQYPQTPFYDNIHSRHSRSNSFVLWQQRRRRWWSQTHPSPRSYLQPNSRSWQSSDP